MNYKKILSTLEHIALVAILSGAVGFYLGNSYGASHVDLKSLKTAQNAPQGVVSAPQASK